MKRIIASVSIFFLVTVSAFAFGTFQADKKTPVSAASIQNGEIYFIQNVGSGYFLDAYNGNTGNNTKVIQWTAKNVNNQKWQALYNSDGTYSFRPLHAQNKRLESLSYKMIIHSDSMHDGKKFYISDTSNGTKILPKKAVSYGNNNAVLVTNGNNGLQVTEGGYNANNLYHHWNLIPISSLPDVALFTVYANDGSGSSSFGWMGHCYISVENISDSTITVGRMLVPAGGSVVLGTWGNQSGHNGLWYNIESYQHYMLDNNHYNGSVSLTMALTAPLLLTLNNEINSYNNTWTWGENCTTFAKHTWNAVSSIKLNTGLFDNPDYLKQQIWKHSYTTNRYLPYNMEVGYYSGSTFIAVNPSTMNLNAEIDFDFDFYNDEEVA